MLYYTMLYCFALYDAAIPYIVIFNYETLYIYIIRIFYTTSITSIVYCVGFYYIEKKKRKQTLYH